MRYSPQGDRRGVGGLCCSMWCELEKNESSCHLLHTSLGKRSWVWLYAHRRSTAMRCNPSSVESRHVHLLPRLGRYVHNIGRQEMLGSKHGITLIAPTPFGNAGSLSENYGTWQSRSREHGFAGVWSSFLDLCYVISRTAPCLALTSQLANVFLVAIQYLPLPIWNQSVHKGRADGLRHNMSKQSGCLWNPGIQYLPTRTKSLQNA